MFKSKVKDLGDLGYLNIKLGLLLPSLLVTNKT